MVARTILLRDRLYNGTLTDSMAREYARLIADKYANVRLAFERMHGKQMVK
jgi:hypothetical protein